MRFSHRSGSRPEWMSRLEPHFNVGMLDFFGDDV
jgi:hypothetical protein